MLKFPYTVSMAKLTNDILYCHMGTFVKESDVALITTISISRTSY